MPTANATAPRRAKKTGARASAARRNASTAGKTAARKTTQTKTTRAKAGRAKAGRAKTARAKAARARATDQTRSAVRQAGTARQWPVSDRSASVVFGDYAERAVLIPVGAALIVRDRVVSSVNDTLSIYSSTSKAQAQLRRFERRGATARNRLEREVRKARVRVERELRQRRREIERTVGDLDERRDAVTKNGTDLANRVQERILSLV
jgi:hypothetical protein